MKQRLSFKLYSLIYFMVAFSAMTSFAIMFADFAIGDWLVDIWHGKVSITDYLDSRLHIIAIMGGYGAFAGLVLWFMFCRRLNIK
ncbi:TPA: hypothetical protein ACNUZK_003636 [Citrobacter braakii]|uniref:hypothetical protein n=1 Tax=Citrobacter TaxID=544 RepID=UPI0019037B03|nr:MULTISPECIES: hypothetical protein [Citrobacter]MBJ9143661.1 hypothetical protein [Citrobacter braakii]MDM3352393.1 hypothetical protein [Citrobacter sp. Cb007]